jgi:UPF0755 protein
MNRNRFFVALFTVFLCFVSALAVGWGIMRHTLAVQISVSTPQYLYIEPGDGVLRVAYKAKSLRLVKRAWHFKVATQLLGVQGKLRAGEYEISSGFTLKSLIEKIVRGEVYYHNFSVPEGASVAQVEDLLIQSVGLNFDGYATPVEGSILPETYYYQRGEKASALIWRMQVALNQYLDEAWARRASATAVNSKEEALVLASIIEKETGVASERAIVSGVFTNRLKKGMRLQSDPTVVYGISLGTPLGRRLTRRDIQQTTPYNTYRVAGLPPTPIANPGRASIEAALNPAEVDYIYFVADGTGGHVFAKTLREHNRNVSRWRQIRDGKEPS